MVKTSPCNAGGAGLIPGQGAKIPHASWPNNKKKNIKRINGKQILRCKSHNKSKSREKNNPVETHSTEIEEQQREESLQPVREREKKSTNDCRLLAQTVESKVLKILTGSNCHPRVL